MIRNYSTFPKFRKQNFWQNRNLHFYSAPLAITGPNQIFQNRTSNMQKYDIFDQKYRKQMVLQQLKTMHAQGIYENVGRVT